MNTKEQGDIGVAHAIYWYTLQGYKVSIPNTDSTRYDLIVDKDGKLFRVQCKTTFRKGKYGKYEVSFRTSGGNQSWNKVVKFISSDETDLVWVTTEDRQAYEFPVELCENKSSFTLGEKYNAYKIIA